MRAAVLHEYGKDFTIEQVPTPEPRPGEVLVRIAGSGACHSDLHVKSGEMPILPELPFILGHENAGYVESLGAGAEGFERGEPVLVYGGWGCGTCRLCLAGDEQVCDLMRWGGIGRPGGFAEFLIVPSTRHLVRLGELDPAESAPLADAALTPYRAIKKVIPRLVPGTTAVIVGIGGLGHYGLQLLKALTPAFVVAVDISPTKRALAEELGADLVLDPLAVDVVEEVAGLTDGTKAAGVIDFVGTDATLATAAGCLGPQGLMVLVGLAGGTLPFSFMGVASEAVITTNSWGNRNDLSEVVALARTGRIRGRVELHPLDQINLVYEHLEHGQVEGRAVLTP
jgi:alcohol dehydrogenase, propanol-preferring